MIKISSPAFPDNGDIPEEYTCDGVNISPPLLIKDIPDGTESLVLVMDDPDAPNKTWTHWIVFDISSDIKEIKENSIPLNASLGLNDFGRIDYGGPCPPSGMHRYFFRIYALDIVLGLQPGITRDVLEGEMEGHVIGEGELMGQYERSGIA